MSHSRNLNIKRGILVDGWTLSEEVKRQIMLSLKSWRLSCPDQSDQARTNLITTCCQSRALRAADEVNLKKKTKVWRHFSGKVKLEKAIRYYSFPTYNHETVTAVRQWRGHACFYLNQPHSRGFHKNQQYSDCSKQLASLARSNNSIN